MVRISLRGVSVTEAEGALAKLWCRVEEFNTAPPRLRFRFLPDGRITVLASFPDADTAQRIVQALGWQAPGWQAFDWPAGRRHARSATGEAANPPEEPAAQA